VLSLPVSIRIFVYTGVTDMRRSFDRLAQMVEEHLEQDPESGHLYLFFNRRRDCVKMLLWEGDGFVIWYSGWKRAPSPCRPEWRLLLTRRPAPCRFAPAI
jgi:transposase